MLACQFCQFGIPAKSSADALMLIGTHTNTVTRRADDNTELKLTLLYSLRKRMCIIGVVTTLGTITTEILHFGTVVLEEQLYLLFERKACVVAGKRDSHFMKAFHKDIYDLIIYHLIIYFSFGDLAI
jgi:hypothetical protein